MGLQNCIRNTNRQYMWEPTVWALQLWEQWDVCGQHVTWHETNTCIWCVYEKWKTSFLGQSLGCDEMDNNECSEFNSQMQAQHIKDSTVLITQKLLKLNWYQHCTQWLESYLTLLARPHRANLTTELLVMSTYLYCTNTKLFTNTHE